MHCRPSAVLNFDISGEYAYLLFLAKKIDTTDRWRQDTSSIKLSRAKTGSKGEAAGHAVQMDRRKEGVILSRFYLCTTPINRSIEWISEVTVPTCFHLIIVHRQPRETNRSHFSHHVKIHSKMGNSKLSQNSTWCPFTAMTWAVSMALSIFWQECE